MIIRILRSKISRIMMINNLIKGLNNKSNCKMNILRMNICMPNLPCLKIINWIKKYQKVHFNNLRKRVWMLKLMELNKV